MIVETLFETLKILFIVFILMTLVEYFMLRYETAIKKRITKKPLTQYVMASGLGAIPGCVDAFFIVSLYTKGIVSFGALVAVMLSTAGDEAFVMLAMIPDAALKIFMLCAVLGVLGGFLADKFVKVFRLKLHRKCRVVVHRKEKQQGMEHFLREHVCGHIIRKHIPTLFLYLFSTLLAINWLSQRFDLQTLLPQNHLMLLVFAALIGIIPESGPHLIFVVLFSQGLIPFSVLLVNTLSQDGHGLLPLISHSLKDTIHVQIFTTLFALAVGLLLFAIGL